MKSKRTRPGRGAPPGVSGDGLERMCVRFMDHLHREYKGRRAEISAWSITKIVKRCASVWGVSDAQLLDALIRRNWLQPDAEMTYIIRYDLVRR